MELPQELAWLLAEVGPGDLAFARIYGANRTPFDCLCVVDDFVVFADDGFGNLYGISVVGAQGQSIWLYLHDEQRWERSGHDDLVAWLQEECIKGGSGDSRSG